MPTGSPPPATEAQPHQDFFPVPFRLLPQPPEVPEKGTLPLVLRLFFPQWKEEEEGAVKACCCNHETRGKTPLWLAEADDEKSALYGPAEDLRGIFGGWSIR